MKKLTLALLLVTVLISCNKSEEKEPATSTPAYVCPTCTTAPEAKAEHDNSSGGVYKGIMVGSSGVVALYLFNTGTEVKMLVTFDGKNTTLVTTSLSGWAPGQAITGATFTGTLDGQAIAVVFSVNANGQNPTMVAAIPGHTVKVAIYKETSTMMVKNYEGTHEGTNPSDNGTFNMTFHGDNFSIVTSGRDEPFVGKLVNGSIDMVADNVEIKGSFSGDDVSGTWKNNNSNTHGTWKGKRTM